MQDPKFRMSDHDVKSRLAKLAPAAAGALERALDGISAAAGGERDGLPLFLLPLAESGLEADAIKRLAEKVPADFPLDHREIYFDFRLDRWIRHIEPPTVAEILDEYLENAETPAQGLAYLEGQWRAFLKRHGRA
jgi:hypothetical protein